MLFLMNVSVKKCQPQYKEEMLFFFLYENQVLRRKDLLKSLACIKNFIIPED